MWRYINAWYFEDAFNTNQCEIPHAYYSLLIQEEMRTKSRSLFDIMEKRQGSTRSIEFKPRLMQSEANSFICLQVVQFHEFKINNTLSRSYVGNEFKTNPIYRVQTMRYWHCGYQESMNKIRRVKGNSTKYFRPVHNQFKTHKAVYVYLLDRYRSKIEDKANPW